MNNGLPTKKETMPLSTRIDAALLDKVKHAAKERGVSLREAIEFGMREFVLQCEKEKQLEFIFDMEHNAK